ncbi:hypothetical protein [Pseudobacteroides cellulosolvens]|uniref:Uncharacterized protein n=1 Tax=Pseudobacteroides cellulosolvens ATCC 35603 = DSM 2933 TaxID=398512 RepID=A0A0L6JW64_9FIRM|nr:hypothetical protein [Pseudobacteroides cellulosolvens]KNY29969.1 hypothetical protein Bccel_5246 [Pseudobacteroides cellulosolvens ATCC 35603 = DSM 2933]
MGKYTKQELEGALQIVSSAISKCEKTQLKFVEGTSHHTLQEYDKSNVYFKMIDNR